VSISDNINDKNKFQSIKDIDEERKSSDKFGCNIE